MSTATIARGGYCATCYLDGITRLCAGFLITKPDGKPAVKVPALDKRLAARVKLAARAYVEANGPGCAASHPHGHETPGVA